ncbi:MAG TPA: hypothetical protein VLS96_18775 [Nodosilinea sp.]|nr:hypothetical protein [Nodosilinea sp.]
MVKYLLHQLSSVQEALALYRNGRLWREVWHQGVRSRWAEVAAAVAFLWLLGLLGSSFVLLSQPAALPLPAASLGLARWVQAGLAVPNAQPGSAAPGRWLLGLVGVGSGLCLVAGTQKLMQLVAALYEPGPPRLRRGRALLPWGFTLLGLGLAGLVASLLAPQSPNLGQWAGLLRLGRWGLALGSVALGLGLVYRLVPPRWVPGLALGPGVRLGLGLGLGLLGLRQWGLGWLASQGWPYGLLLAAGLNLAVLYLLIVLVPVGAQFNLSAQRHRRAPTAPWGIPRTVAPPSFDSFKIRRRSD